MKQRKSYELSFLFSLNKLRLVTLLRQRYFRLFILPTLIEKDRLGDCSPENGCCLEMTFRQPVQKPFLDRVVLPLKMASALVVETSVTNNSPSQDFNHPDDPFQSRYVTPGFKPFSYLSYNCIQFSFNFSVIFALSSFTLRN